MADLSTLDSLAAHGFDAVRGDQLSALAAWCWEWGIATGDARFCVISVVLDKIDAWTIEHEEGGGVPSGLLAEVGQIVQAGLTESLAADSAAAGARRAHEMGLELPLLPASQWVRGGWATEAP